MKHRSSYQFPRPEIRAAYLEKQRYHLLVLSNTIWADDEASDLLFTLKSLGVRMGSVSEADGPVAKVATEFQIPKEHVSVLFFPEEWHTGAYQDEDGVTVSHCGPFHWRVPPPGGYEIELWLQLQ